MHEEEHCQQVKGSDSNSVLSAGETSGVLSSGGVVTRSEYKKDKDVLEQIQCSATKGAGTCFIHGDSKRAGCVQPGEEEVQGIISMCMIM